MKKIATAVLRLSVLRVWSVWTSLLLEWVLYVGTVPSATPETHSSVTVYANIATLFLSPLLYNNHKIKILTNVFSMTPSASKFALTPMEDTCALVRMAISLWMEQTSVKVQYSL